MVKHMSSSTEMHLQYANRKIQQQSDHIKSLSERFTQQTVVVSKLETSVFKLETTSKATISRLEKQLAFNSQILESQAQQGCGRFSGVLIWEVPNFNKKFQGVKRGNNTYTKYLYALDGYKMKVDLYLNGNGDNKGKHVSIFIYQEPGPFDDALEWPMKAQIIFSVMKDELEVNSNSFKTDHDNETKKDFQNPTYNNCRGRGTPAFIDHNHIQDYVIDNKLTLKITVKSL